MQSKIKKPFSGKKPLKNEKKELFFKKFQNFKEEKKEWSALVLSLKNGTGKEKELYKNLAIQLIRFNILPNNREMIELIEGLSEPTILDVVKQIAIVNPKALDSYLNILSEKKDEGAKIVLAYYYSFISLYE